MATPERPALTRELREAIVSAVLGLGADAEEIAATLAGAGVKGFPEEPCACPIARYIEQRWPKTDPHVTDRLHLYGGESDWFFVFPDRMQSFITAFDNGRHPELEEEDA